MKLRSFLKTVVAGCVAPNILLAALPDRQKWQQSKRGQLWVLNPEWVNAEYAFGYLFYAGENEVPPRFFSPTIHDRKCQPAHWVGDRQMFADPWGPRVTVEGKLVLPSLVPKV